MISKIKETLVKIGTFSRDNLTPLEILQHTQVANITFDDAKKLFDSITTAVTNTHIVDDTIDRWNVYRLGALAKEKIELDRLLNEGLLTINTQTVNLDFDKLLATVSAIYSEEDSLIPVFNRVVDVIATSNYFKDLSSDFKTESQVIEHCNDVMVMKLRTSDLLEETITVMDTINLRLTELYNRTDNLEHPDYETLTVVLPLFQHLTNCSDVDNRYIERENFQRLCYSIVTTSIEAYHLSNHILLDGEQVISKLNEYVENYDDKLLFIESLVSILETTYNCKLKLLQYEKTIDQTFVSLNNLISDAHGKVN